MQAVVLIAAIVLLYAAFSGLWGVVTTDFFQLALALIGALWSSRSTRCTRSAASRCSPRSSPLRGRAIISRSSRRSGSALLPLPTFLAYVSIQWWAYKGADGGGQFVQRLVSVPSEQDAENAAWLFNIINYVVRCWPWIMAALIAMLVLPGLADREMAYPLLMKRYLPAGMLGLVFASLVAAFMSSVSAQVNWGASYLVNDVYRRFLAPPASDRSLVWAGRLASLIITAVASFVAFNLHSIGETFRLLIALGTGTGAVLILRWFWWRINVWAEIAALVGSVLVAALIYSVPSLRALEFGIRETGMAAVVTALWLTVMWLTPPESDETLDAFYSRARPGGAWGPVRARTGHRAAPASRERRAPRVRGRRSAARRQHRDRCGAPAAVERRGRRGSGRVRRHSVSAARENARWGVVAKASISRRHRCGP